MDQVTRQVMTCASLPVSGCIKTVNNILLLARVQLASESKKLSADFWKPPQYRFDVNGIYRAILSSIAHPSPKKGMQKYAKTEQKQEVLSLLSVISIHKIVTGDLNVLLRYTEL